MRDSVREVNLPSSPLGHYFHVEEELWGDSVSPAQQRLVGLWQLEGILWLPWWVPPWSQGEASTAALVQRLIKAVLGWMGSMVMIAWPGQLTQCYFLAFCFPCHLALYHTITQIRRKKRKGRRIWLHLIFSTQISGGEILCISIEILHIEIPPNKA